ncbi:MAG: S8 family serine peptidase [Phycisphaerales bacterium]|nr:S8 family serine peptidase [Phycisphaerales bacterium]
MRAMMVLAAVMLVACPEHGAAFEAGAAGAGSRSSSMIVMVNEGVFLDSREGEALGIFCNQPINGSRSDGCESGQRLAAQLLADGAIRIEPYLSIPPRNPGLAAQVGLDRMYRIVFSGAVVTADHCASLASTFPGEIQYAVEPARAQFLAIEPDDPLYPQQWPLNNVGQGIDDLGESLYECDGVGTVPPGLVDADMDVPEAWALEVGAGDVLVAVIDTGADLDHPELAAKLVDGYNFIPGEDPLDTQDSIALSHGTAIAGIIAAETNNGIGMAGVCWNCPVMPIRIGDWAEASYFSIQTCAEALVWAVDNGADVANMSWGVNPEIQPGAVIELSPALEYARLSSVVLVAAAGNLGDDSFVYYPASDSRVIGVGATTVTDEHPCFSHTGIDLSVCAPGVNYLMTWNDEVGEQFPFCPAVPYCVASGTSFSTAMVSGVAGLVRSANPGLSTLEVKELIESTADDLGEPGFDDLFGHGRINAYQAVCEARRRSCVGDLDGDGDVDVDDLLGLIGSWGQGAGVGDINCDQVVEVDDLLEALGQFGSCVGG